MTRKVWTPYQAGNKRDSERDTGESSNIAWHDEQRRDSYFQPIIPSVLLDSSWPQDFVNLLPTVCH